VATYALDALGAEEFEHLAQDLVKVVVGNGSVTYGKGPDGGREATFDGVAPYPSASERWRGHWIFQAKYVDVGRAGAGEARRTLLARLKDELERIVRSGKACNNYILITNVPLSSVVDTGTHDVIAEQIAPAFPQIRNLHVWGYDDIARLLDLNPHLRAVFPSLLQVGDFVLRQRGAAPPQPLDETIRLFLATEYQEDRYAQLDQAGDTGIERLSLADVFVDLDVQPRATTHPREVGDERNAPEGPAMELLVSERLRHVVFVGGPGHGKSTLGQFAAQIHRSMLLKKVQEVLGDDDRLLPPDARVPFRIVLRDLAQWVGERPEREELVLIERYLAERVARAAGLDAPLSMEQMREVLRRNRTLIILDGLDEVSEPTLRTRVIDAIDAFLERVESALGADVQVVGSSRPTGYEDEFRPDRFIHLELLPLSEERAGEYVERWVTARGLGRERAESVRAHYRESVDDAQIRLLLTTPLQVNIVIYVILSGGRPSHQRESLFSDYVDVIYRRERSKPRSTLKTEKDTLLGLHQYLGYLLHRRASQSRHVASTLTSEEFREEVRRFLRHANPYLDPPKLEQQTETLVSEARERLVLLVESSPDRFGFELRSLQEYFAASHLVDSARSSEERVDRFRTIAISTHWRNVALFFAGRMGRAFRGEAANVVDVCRAIDRELPDRLLRRGAGLALALATDRAFGSNASLQRSTVETAATRVECDPLTWLETSEALFAGLTEEDCADHATPALAAKLPALSFDRLLVIQPLLQQPGIDMSVLVALLEEHCLTGAHDCAHALRGLLMLPQKPERLSVCTRACIDQAPAQTFGTAIGDVALADPRRFAAALGNAELSVAHARALVAAAARDLRFGRRLRGVDPIPPVPVECPVLDAVIHMLVLIQWLGAVADGPADDMPARPVDNERLQAMRARLAQDEGDPLLVDAIELVNACGRVACWDVQSLDFPGVVPLWRAIDAELPEVTALLHARLTSSRADRVTPVALVVDELHNGASSGVGAAVLERMATEPAPEAAWRTTMHGIRDLLAGDQSLREAFSSGAGDLGGESPEERAVADATGVSLRELQPLAADLFLSPTQSRSDALELLRGASVRLTDGRLLEAARFVNVASEALVQTPSLAPHVWQTAIHFLNGIVRRGTSNADVIGAATHLLVACFPVAISERGPLLRSWLATIGSSPAHTRPLVTTTKAGTGGVVPVLAGIGADGSPEVMRGAAQCIKLLLTLTPGAGAVRPDDLTAYLDSGDAICEQAGMALLAAMDHNFVGAFLLSRFDSGCMSPLPNQMLFLSNRAIPDEPAVHARLVTEISTFLERPGAGAQARGGLLRYLRALADAIEPELSTRESELGLPLAHV